ncbi:hypothetical protein THAOC_04223, partial [Thalassiosira oceanica]
RHVPPPDVPVVVVVGDRAGLVRKGGRPDRRPDQVRRAPPVRALDALLGRGAHARGVPRQQPPDGGGTPRRAAGERPRRGGVGEQVEQDQGDTGPEGGDTHDTASRTEGGEVLPRRGPDPDISMSSVLQAEDAVRLPSCVNSLGEYLTISGDNIRESGGDAVAAYAFSSLEQYIPFYLMQSARIMAGGARPITMNGIESLDRTGSVLYRDLKGATGFEGSFWDEGAAAESFEGSAVFVSLMELTMGDLEDFYRENPGRFSDKDYALMFQFSGPRRRGDSRRFNLLKSKLKTERRGG